MDRAQGTEPNSTLSVDEARERILAAIRPLPPVSIPLITALGRVLAEEIVASLPLPPFTNAAMDGFAVRVADTAGASPAAPVRLRVIGEAAAGNSSPPRVEPGTAIRIMTGAPVPEGADAIVRFEETDYAERSAERESIAVLRAPRPGEHIRLAGEDVPAGATVLRSGTPLRPADLGLIAALGRTEVRVHRRPRVAILATGDEVVAPGEPISAGRIYDSNSTLIAALVQQSGGESCLLGIARDNLGAVRAKLEEARQADLIITAGGVSAGDFDVVKEALRLEGEIAFWQVRMRPGKPLAFGQVGGIPLLGLPGNPVAAAVCYLQFGHAAVRTLLGHPVRALPTARAVLLDRVENRGGRRHFVRVRVARADDGRLIARLVGPQGAGILSSLVGANGLLVVPEELAVAEPGMVLPVQLLDLNASEANN
ncbi:MAG TPA: gephyrin-like molybdotransferase Glp [Thermomicrobiales bacterium]